MKQINDLLVVEVPKEAANITVENVGGVNRVVFNQTNLGEFSGIRWADVDLPDGEWEIIGLKSSMNELSNRDFLTMILQMQKAGEDYVKTESLYGFLLKNGINIETLEADLLFLKRITSNQNNK